MKKETEDTKGWEDLPRSRIGRINVKMDDSPEEIYTINAILIKISTQFFIERKISETSRRNTENQDCKTILDNKKTAGNFTIPDLKQYYIEL